MNRHALAVVMINRADAVARISGLLAARKIRLESIIGGPTDDPDYFLFRLVIEADENQARQTARQIAKLVDTIRVEVVPCSEKALSPARPGGGNAGGAAESDPPGKPVHRRPGRSND